MNRELRRAKERAEQAWSDAVQAAHENMTPYIKHDFAFRVWSRAIDKMYKEQWLDGGRHDDAGWCWPKIAGSYSDIKGRTVALVSKERLSALADFKVSKSRVLVGFLEGDPRLDCHMKGVRALLMLDLAATYGQRLGRRELHLQPVNGQLAELYRSRFSFIDATDGNGEAILMRSLI